MRTTVLMVCLSLMLAGTVAAQDSLNCREKGSCPFGTSRAVALDPPPFGTVVQSWELQMSGDYAGAGITWRRDSGRFYLMDQAYVGEPGVWSLDPVDPLGTLRRENWVIPNLGTDTIDIPWSIAWDSDSNCYWISDIVDGDIFGGCYYIRIRQTAVGDTWRWFNQNPGDTWLVGDGSCGGAGNMYWMAGSEKWPDRGYFACAPMARTGPNNHVWKFDPYTKTSFGRCAHGDTFPESGCTLVPWDSNYIVTAGWMNSNYLHKRDSTGLPLEGTPGIDIADIAVWVPQIIGPDDTVFMYAIVNDPPNTLQKRSVGLLWGQLEPGHAIDEPGRPVSAADDHVRVEPNPCRGSATIRLNFPLLTSYSLSLHDITGRAVLTRTLGSRERQTTLDLRNLSTGVYVLRLDAGTFTCSQKMILQH